MGSRVVVQGRAVPVDEEGNFKADVNLRDGKQQMAVTVVDVLGREKVAGYAIEFDAKKPGVKLEEKPWPQ